MESEMIDWIKSKVSNPFTYVSTKNQSKLNWLRGRSPPNPSHHTDSNHQYTF